MIDYPQYLDKRPTSQLSNLLFVAVALFTAIVSGFTTYLGLKNDLELELAVAVAVIVFLALFLVNLQINKLCRKGGRLVGALVALAITMIISFMSNTNAIYTRLIERVAVSETRNAAYNTFIGETSELSARLEQLDSVKKLRAQLTNYENAKQEFRAQLLDENRQGFGGKAKQELKKIEDFVGPTTRLQAPARPALQDGASSLSSEQQQAYQQALSAYADRYEVVFEEKKARVLTTKSGGPEYAVLEKLNSQQTEIEKLMALSPEREHSERIATSLTNLVGEASPYLTPSFRAKTVNTRLDDTGSIAYLLDSIGKRLFLGHLAVAIILGLILDLLTPVYSIALFRIGEKDE